ncbi:MAG TPA: aminotransferase class I/II-fold pyridoxal phosphate-dependent enzyme [Thermoanaerobaculia bacterium]|nr:aminotransferase class I/II-fold pyridoxal phosphate-dependent enzyme [Thermoanaerobaculia bacterium]
MRIETFRMERMQCVYEKEVAFDLSESGVVPLSVQELLDGEPVERFLATRLAYPRSDGSRELRERIADWYPGATADNVTVVNGGAEANHAVLWSLLEPGKGAAILLPNYLQAWGLARHWAHATAFHLRHDRAGNRWALDLDGLRKAVTKKTRVLLVTNPNNPTGAVFTEEEMAAVVAAARRVGAWLVADEIYRGAELAGGTTPTFWGRYDRTIVTSGLSKAFGLPGLRTGWVVAPKSAIAEIWRRHDYLTLTPGMLSDQLAAIAMEPARREGLLERTRDIVRRQLPELEGWVARRPDVFDWIPPRAGAIAFVPYRLPIAPTPLAERIRREQSVLVVPGDMLGGGRAIRFGFGYDVDRLREGLARVARVTAALARAPRAGSATSRTRGTSVPAPPRRATAPLRDRRRTATRIG